MGATVLPYEGRNKKEKYRAARKTREKERQRRGELSCAHTYVDLLQHQDGGL